ncbi:MAG: D-alanine/D-alanine ligase [Candidatus Saccharibacteria bacterium]|nr:D-alanine/D-alanine ligase [Candidatus Saccharibacteria bacterium]
MQSSPTTYTKPVILLLFGSDSPEHDISLVSARNVASVIDTERYELLLGYVDRNRLWHKVDAVEADDTGKLMTLIDKHVVVEDAVIPVDVVLPIIHGVYGEDGIVQSALEKTRLPYLGSDASASERAFDKVELKVLLAENSILTPNWELVTAETFPDSDLRRNPYVLKPVKGGSSIDTFIVHNPARETHDYTDVFARHGHMLLEELIIGQEITVGVLGGTALPVILIIPPDGEEFDFENKYNGRSQEIVAPDTLAAGVTQRAQALAAHIHKLSSLKHLSRIDMIVTPDHSIYTLECNTMPGMTAQSLLPKAAAAKGYDLPRLVEEMIGMVRHGVAV